MRSSRSVELKLSFQAKQLLVSECRLRYSIWQNIAIPFQSSFDDAFVYLASDWPARRLSIVYGQNGIMRSSCGKGGRESIEGNRRGASGYGNTASPTNLLKQSLLPPLLPSQTPPLILKVRYFILRWKIWTDIPSKSPPFGKTSFHQSPQWRRISSARQFRTPRCRCQPSLTSKIWLSRRLSPNVWNGEMGIYMAASWHRPDDGYGQSVFPHLLSIPVRKSDKWSPPPPMSTCSVASSAWWRFRKISFWTNHFSTLVYRGEIYSLQILLSRTQAGPGRQIKQEQEDISRNHAQSF